MTPNPLKTVATGEAGGEAAPRPKFSRRPASFSRAAPPAAAMAEPAPAQAAHSSTDLVLRPEPIPASTAHRPETAWQEDARFGVAMLVLVLLVNLALIYGLPLLPRPSPASPTEQVVKIPTMPDAMGSTPAGVTLYSQPAEERRTVFDLHQSGGEQNALSVSPDDIPAPQARPLSRQVLE